MKKKSCTLLLLFALLLQAATVGAANVPKDYIRDPAGELSAEMREELKKQDELKEDQLLRDRIRGLSGKTTAPETEAPETEAPETEAPETEAPETEAPETEAPETEAPETEAPVDRTIPAPSETVLGSGQCGENLTWTVYDNGLLVISGTGEMEDYDELAMGILFQEGGHYAPWVDYNVAYAVIEEGVTRIGNGAFQSDVFGGNDELLAVSFPSTLVSIGDDAFYLCGRLGGELNLPASLESIGSYAFSGTNFTGKLVLPITVRTGNRAFGSAANLELTRSSEGLPAEANPAPSGVVTAAGEAGENVTWTLHDNGVLVISGNGVVADREDPDVAPWEEYKESVRYLQIDEGITGVGYAAFVGLTNLTGTLTLPSTLEYIGIYAFAELSGLTGNLVIPGSVKAIGTYAFVDCTGMTGTLTLEDGVQSIGERAFYRAGFRGNLVLPNSVTSVGTAAFARCKFNGSLTLSNQLEVVGDAAFWVNSDLIGRLTIPEGVKTIGMSAFESCSGLTGTLTIPSSVTEIRDSAFLFCSGFSGDLVIPGSVKVIEHQAFAGLSGVYGALVLSEGVTEIGELAFCESNASSLSLPNTLERIGNRAFYACDFAEQVLEIPGSVKFIGEQAFRECEFTGVVLHEGLETIEDRAFEDNSSLTGTVVIPDSVTLIRETAFDVFGKDENVQIVLPEGLTYADGKLLGDTFGTEAYGGSETNSYDKAWDGNTSTFFDPAESATDSAYTAINVNQYFEGGRMSFHSGVVILSEIRIFPREGYLDRFEGAEIQGSNDQETWTTIWKSDAAASSLDWQVIPADQMQNNTGYAYYRYVNTVNHGNVAEIALYGHRVSSED